MDLSRYLGLWVSDARDHLAGIESMAVRLEHAPEGSRREPLDTLFRHLHSLKGSAATMGFDAVARLAHAAEELAGRLRDGDEQLAPGVIDLFLETRDALRTMVDVASEGGGPEPHSELVERLTRRERPARETPASAAQPLVALPEGPHTIIELIVSTKSATPAARAFLALRRVEQVAPCHASIPSLDELKAGRIPGHRLLAVLRGDVPMEALEKAVARVPEIERVGPATLPTAPAAPAPAPAAAPAGLGERTVRVQVELLDQLLELAGELLLSSARLRELARPVGADALADETDRLRLLVKELNNRVLVARQTPLSLLAERLPRAVRDLSRQLGRPIALTIEGSDVALDRGLLEALVDPVLHVVRNAADHGLEPPAERVRAGKPDTGHLTLSARRGRDHVILSISDDGRGFDAARLRAKAVRTGVLTQADADRMSDTEALRLAFLPGLTTRDTTTELSGRGVGMDAVLRAIEQLGGTVGIASMPGLGSTISFELPATVSVTNVLLFTLGEEIFGVPANRVLFAALGDAAANDLSVAGGERIPAHALGRLLGLPEQEAGGERPYIVFDAEGQRTAVGVDDLLGQEEVVLRPLVPPLERIRGLSGTAILGSGRPVFVLDVPRLVA